MLAYLKLSDFKKGRIVDMLETGWSQAAVAKHLDRSRSVIQVWWNRWQYDGNNENHLRLLSSAYSSHVRYKRFNEPACSWEFQSHRPVVQYHAFHWLMNTDNEDYHGFKTVWNDPQKTGIRFFLMNQGSLCDTKTAESKFIVFPQNASSRRVERVLRKIAPSSKRNHKRRMLSRHFFSV